MMSHPLTSAAVLAALQATQAAPPWTESGNELPMADGVSFGAPLQVHAGGRKLKTEAPGFASPAFYDFDGDGRDDLVVGQYAGGRMSVYRRLEDGTFAAGEWILAGGEPAEVPGIG